MLKKTSMSNSPKKTKDFVRYKRFDDYKIWISHTEFVATTIDLQIV